jgi:PKD repeat protein
LSANSIFAEYKTAFPESISDYSTLFVCLGVGTKKHVLSTNEGQMLAAFVDAGGNLYMEGGDTWYYDPKTAVHPKFKTNGVMDGNSDLSTETGQTGKFAEGLSFTYTGDKDFIDHISANPPAYNLFKNVSPIYISAVAYDAGTYQTISSAFEFGGLANGEGLSTRNEYMRRIIEFFGIMSSPYTANFMGDPINICDGGTVTYNDYSSPGTTSWEWTFPGGTPETSSEPNPVITYSNPGTYTATLIVSNGTFNDTLVKEDYVWVAYCTDITDARKNELSIFPNPFSDIATLSFGSIKGNADLKLTDVQGKSVLTASQIPTNQAYTLDLSGLPAGLYFVTITSDGTQIGKKIVVKK